MSDTTVGRLSHDAPAFQRGGFDTLTAALNHAAAGNGALNFFDHRGRMTGTLTHNTLRQQALDIARGLRASGLSAGQHVALVAETGPAFAAHLFACFYAGLVAVPLPTPRAIGNAEQYASRLARQLNDSAARAVIGPPRMRAELSAIGRDVGTGTVAFYGEVEAATADLPAVSAGDTCYIQYSSGSTRAPRGVVLTHAQVARNATDILDRLAVTPADRGVFWLPWFHDMGLVGGLIAPICSQSQVDFLAPEDFVRRPLVWLELMSGRRATISFATGFAYDLCARAAGAKACEFDLSNWRVAGVGAEPIRGELLTRFAERFAANGFAATAFLASYGLAEATLAVTMTQPGQGLGGPTPDARIACGTPVGATEIEICDERGEVCAPEQTGRVHVRGGGIAAGYFRDGRVEAFSDDGWLDTSDMGFFDGCGQLVIAGRSDELIILHGRNIWPDDIEACAREVLGESGAACAAFGVLGNDQRQAAAVVIEQAKAMDALDTLTAKVAGAVMAEFAVDCDVRFVKRRGLPRTSSGKISRAAAKEAFVRGLPHDRS